jgi:hypothetical protein
MGQMPGAWICRNRGIRSVLVLVTFFNVVTVAMPVGASSNTFFTEQFAQSSTVTYRSPAFTLP